MEKLCNNPKCRKILIGRDKIKYCSRSCSATVTGHTHPKRTKTTVYCIYCKLEIPYGRKYCKNKDCNKSFLKCNFSEITLEQITAQAKYQKSARIRQHARDTFLRSKNPKCCKVCKYELHIEICHIKPIKSFSLTTLIKEVNAIENLIALCPNCHWELDNGLISLEFLKGL